MSKDHPVHGSGLLFGYADRRTEPNPKSGEAGLFPRE